MCKAWNEEVYSRVLARERGCARCSLALTSEDCCGADGGAEAFRECCASCRTGSGIMLTTPELLGAYFEALAKRLTVASVIEPALDAWRDLQREHNAATPPERFTEPAARPRVPEPAAAAAAAGKVASLLPLQLGERMAGVSAAPPARESKTAAQRR